MLTGKPKSILIYGAVGLFFTAAAVILLTTAVTAPATVRLAHLSPNTSALDFYVNDVQISPALSFGQVGPTLAVTSGQANITVRLAGTSPGGAVLHSANVSLVPGGSYIIAVANTLERLQVTTHLIPNANLVGAHGRVQFIHAVPAAPRLDITLSDGRLMLNDIGYLEQPSPWFDLPTGQYHFLGTTETDPRVLAFDLPALTLETGTVYTVIIAGSPAGAPPIQTIVVATR